MQLGFNSAILPDLGLKDLLAFARDERFSTVELMCWPVGKAERRYAGVTHVDVSTFGPKEAAEVARICEDNAITISALGYYPNLMVPDEATAKVYADHFLKVVDAASELGVPNANTFVGRDPALNLDENWKRFDQRWPRIVEHAEKAGVNIGIENCPMFFTQDEWPGGANMAVSPAIWREMFRRLPSKFFGLNYDPSHLIWQMMDPVAPIRDFADRITHVHAKDVRIDRRALHQKGILVTPLEFHEPKLPGLGEVPWGAFFAALGDIRYTGPVCIEVEDRSYEGSLEMRKESLRQSARFLRQFMPTKA